MSAIILAKTIYDRREMLQLRGELKDYVARLAKFQLFSVGEIAEISGMSEYRVRRNSPHGMLVRAKSGVYPRHLDHAMRMVSSQEFARIHVRSLVQDGATPAALSRVTGQPESSLRRWARKDQSNV